MKDVIHIEVILHQSINYTMKKINDFNLSGYEIISTFLSTVFNQ